jgi:hypothetical protein
MFPECSLNCSLNVQDDDDGDDEEEWVMPSGRAGRKVRQPKYLEDERDDE